jgi:hypothetical protein
MFQNACGQRFSAWRCGGILAQMLMRRTKLSVSTKLSAENETPPIANVLLAVRFLFVIRVYKILFIQSFVPNVGYNNTTQN